MRRRLSTNFYLDEFLVSETALRHGIPMTPPPEVVDELERLCQELLQPLRAELGVPITITSGWRPSDLNRLIGSSDRSDHIVGRAADVRAAGVAPIDLCKRALDMHRAGLVPLKQAIHEFGAWAHLSIPPAGSERHGEALTAYRSELGKTRYEFGLFDVDPMTGLRIRAA